MKGRGKHRGYELHHPMSLGDLLAALFRRKPKSARAGETGALRVPREKQEMVAAESTLLLNGEDRDDAAAMRARVE